MLGLHTPQTAVLQIVDEATPKETSLDKIERVLNELLEEHQERPDHSLSGRLRFLDELCLRQFIGWIVYGQQIGVDQ